MKPLWRRRPHFRVPSAESALVTGADEVMAHAQTYGERIEALEAERDRLRAACLHVLRYGNVGKQSRERLREVLR